MTPDVDADKRGVTRGVWQRILEPLGVYLPLEVGAVAEDKETGRRVLVCDTYDAPADEIEIEELGATVAEANPDWPATDRVVSVVYLGSLADHHTDCGTYVVARDARRADVPKYDFPATRLETVAPDRITISDFELEGAK